MSRLSLTRPAGLLLVWLARLLRLAARGFRLFRRTVFSFTAIREIRDEALFSELTPAELRAHETMLADTPRMDAYRRGISRAVNAGDVVVDLGTGTGILAMLAAQRNPKVVHAIDFSNIAFFAERIALANGFTNIEFHQASSRRFTIDERVDVVVHEQIGQGLIDEGLIEKTLDIKQRLLAPTGRIVPGKYEMFLEPATVKDEYRVPYLWQHTLPGIEFSSVRASHEYNSFKGAGNDWQVDARAAIDCFLCDPAPILTLDLNEITEPSDVPSRVSASRMVSRAGRLDGFCFYFRVIFDDDVDFSTSPFAPRTHWENLFVRVESRECRRGDTLSYALNMMNRHLFETWSIELTTDPVTQSQHR